MNNQSKIIFGTGNYIYLRNKILGLGTFEKGEVEKENFPDGERYQRITSDVEDREVILVGGTISDSDTLELYDLASALVKYGASALTLVIPYFGYSTMERAVKKGEVVTAKTRARLFSSLPRSNKGNKILLFDLHTEGQAYYFEEGIRPVHIYCKQVIMEAAIEMGGKDFVLASTDAGRAKWVESLANEMGINPAFVFKRRTSGRETVITSISADVKGKNVVIYDDMIRSGGSLINAARAYKEAGANEISVVATHGLLIENAVEKLKDSKLFKGISVTDSHPNAMKIKDRFVKIKSIAGLIAGNI